VDSTGLGFWRIASADPDRVAIVDDDGRVLPYGELLEHSRSIARVKWRTGCEGRISCAKRDFGLARTRLDGIDGARTWCGHGIFAHNLVKIAGLTP